MPAADKPIAHRRPRGRPRAFNDRTQQNVVKSVDRAMVLMAHLSGREDATLGALAHDLGEAPSTLYRVLTTLQRHGMVEADETAQTWHVGSGAFRIGSAFLRRTSLIDRSRPALRRLMAASGETANLGILDGDEVLFVSQVETHAPIRAFFPPGTRASLHASGIGKVLLAGMDAPGIDRILRAGLARFTDHTLTDPDRLRANLDAVRDRGIAIDDEERNEGMRCIAAPVRNLHGEVIAGLSVSGPISRVTRGRVAELKAMVVAAADTVTQGMGGPPAADG